MKEIDIIAAIEDSWNWVANKPSKILYLNDFGNIIFQDEKSDYWLLRPEELICKVIAETDQDMANLWSDEEFVVDWKMQTLVDISENHLGENSVDRCFYFVISPIFGGAYSIENIKTISILELIAFSGNIANQIKDVPDGAKIEIKITD